MRDLLNERCNYKKLSQKLSEGLDQGQVVITYGGQTLRFRDEDFKRELAGLVDNIIKEIDNRLQVL